MFNYLIFQIWFIPSIVSVLNNHYILIGLTSLNTTSLLYIYQCIIIVYLLIHWIIIQFD